jgi:hypothetical protein
LLVVEPAGLSAADRCPDEKTTLVLRSWVRAVALPALLCLAGGSLLGIVTPSGLAWPGPAARVGDIFRPGTLPVGVGVSAAGLLALAILPASALALLMVSRLRARCWLDAGLAAAVFAVLVLSAVAGR